MGGKSKFKFEGLLRIKICHAYNVGHRRRLFTALFALFAAPWLVYYSVYFPGVLWTPLGSVEAGDSLSLLAVRVVLAASCCFCLLQFVHAIRASGLLNGTFWDDSFVVFSHGWNTYRTKEASTRHDPTWNEFIPVVMNESNMDYSLQFSIYEKKLLESNKLVGTCSLSFADLVELYRIQRCNFPFYGLKDLEELLKLRSKVKAKSNGSGSQFLSNYSILEQKRFLEVAQRSTAKGCLWLPCESPNSKAGQQGDVPLLGLQLSFDTKDYLSKRLWYWIFNQFDSRNERKISKVELGACLEAVGNDVTDERLDMLFAGNNQDAMPWRKAYEILSKNESILSQLDTMSAASKNTEFLLFKTCPVCQESLKHDYKNVVVHLAICISSGSSAALEQEYVTAANARDGWLLRLRKYVTRGTFEVGANTGNILVQDRATGEIVEERMPVSVRLAIRVLYQTLLRRNIGKRTLQLFKSLTVKQGKKLDTEASVSGISTFIDFYNVNLEEVDYKSLDDFKTFNEFFYRRLKPGARTADSFDPMIVLSPADCRCVVYQSLTKSKEFWIKGQNFSAETLLANSSIDHTMFESIAICRLAPQDYHRFHCPVECTFERSYTVDGKYFTVNPMAIRERIDVFTDNIRTVAILNSDIFGKIAYVCVGAMMVGSVVLTVKPGQELKRMDEVGYFAFGGSTVILLFEKNSIKFDKDLRRNSKKPIETLIKVGNSLGRFFNQ